MLIIIFVLVISIIISIKYIIDKENKEDLFEYLSNVRIKNTCLIIATHDNDLDSFFTDKKVLVL